MSDKDKHFVVWAVPTFLTDDVAATADWYRDTLGFKIAGNFPEERPWAYASLQINSAEIMLLSRPGYRKLPLDPPRPTGHWDAYLRTIGVRDLYDQIKTTTNPPSFIEELRLMPYGNWEFTLEDPNGYRLVFGGKE